MIGCRKHVEYILGLPTPKDKLICITAFHDSGLAICKAKGKASTGVIKMINQTPVDWYSKMQMPVETATYGSEFSSATTCTDKIVDTLWILKSMSVPLDGPAWIFGDNESVIMLSIIPHYVLGTRHTFLTYHSVRYAVSYDIMHYCYHPNKQNIRNILTKSPSYKKCWLCVKP